MLRLVLITSFALSMRAAPAHHACEADPATAQFLTSWQVTASDTRLGYDARTSPLWKAIEADPGNVFLHHAYQRPVLTYIGSIRVPAVEAAYQKLLDAHPDDLALRYAYARLLYGTRTAESKRMLESVIAADPGFPWPHLALARVHQNKAFADEARFREESERFFAFCPAPLSPEAYEQYRSLPRSLRVQIAGALRERLSGETPPAGMTLFSTLWQFEFQNAADQHEQVRARLTADLRRIREAAGSNPALLKVALQGYELVEDREGALWARDRIAAVAPHSSEACTIAIQRWLSDRSRPTMEDSRERVEGYYRELLAATESWIAKCPLAEDPWILRLRAVRELPSATADQVLQAGDGMVKASEANPSTWGVAPSIPVAELYAERDVGWDRLPGLISRDQRDARERLASDRRLDWFPESWRQADELNAAESRLEAHLLEIRRHLRVNQREKAGAELTAAEKEVANTPGETAMWRLRPLLVDACVVMGESAKAKAALAPLQAWLESHSPSETANRTERLQYRARQADHAERAAALAEMEEDKEQAIALYQQVLRSRSVWQTLSARFAMLDKTAALWKAVGRSAEDWQQWRAALSATILVPAQNWNRVERAVPDFSLTDLEGRKWNRASLEGKTTLVNLWATWCGPCIAELPYVQKIYNAVRGRKDVQVISLNVDENPGLIAPFLKQRGITSLPVIPALHFVQDVMRVNGFPVTWIVDPDGVVRREQTGFTGEPSKWVELCVATLVQPEADR